MPIWFQIDLSRQLLTAEAEGVVTAHDVADVLRRALEDPDFGPGLRQLCDLRGLTEVKATYQELRELKVFGDDLAAQLQSGRLALVADRDDVFGMLRMYQSIFDDLPIEIGAFRDEGEARSWLGIAAS